MSRPTVNWAEVTEEGVMISVSFPQEDRANANRSHSLFCSKDHDVYGEDVRQVVEAMTCLAEDLFNNWSRLKVTDDED